MATRIYAVDPGGQNIDVQENVGPTATSAIVAVVVNLASGITEGSGTRGPSQSEVLEALENITAHILRTNTWPPA